MYKYLKREEREIYKLEVKKKLEESGLEYNADNVAKLLLNRWEEYDYHAPKMNIVVKQYKDCGKTPLQRFNLLWVSALALLCYPFRYVMFGYGGLDTRTKFGKVICKLVGEG